MPAEQLDTLRLLLGVIVLLAVCYWLVPDEERLQGRDLEREHSLGAHKSMPAWGCKRCGEKR